MTNAKLASQCDSCEMVLHTPITRIPPEILSYIFCLYLPSLDEQMSASPPSPQCPSCLAQVCRLWRTVVESDPHLWASIHLYFHEQSRCNKDAQRMQAIFDLHLKRSGTLPLSLTFTDCRYYVDKSDNTELISLFTNQLQRHSRRWKHIFFHLPTVYFSRLFMLAPCDLSSLECLHISSEGKAVFYDVPHLCLDSATTIKSFTSGGSFSSLIHTIDLPWGQLEEVSFNYAHDVWLKRQFTHLGDCQNLITCSLGINMHSLRSLRSLQTINLPRLQTLRIRRLSVEADTHLFDFLILPRLETLEIDSRFLLGFNRTYTHWEDRVFSFLLARSGCALRHLSIQDVDFSNEELVRCLVLSPTLTSLCFIPYPRSQDTGDVIRKLVSPATIAMGIQTQIQERRQIDDGTDLPLPQLQEITLAISKERSLKLMTTMLRLHGNARTRAEGVAALRRVEVIFFRNPRNPYLRHPPRAKLKKVEAFRRTLAEWASEVRMENARGEVVAKVGIRSTTTDIAEMIRKGTW